MPLLVSHLPQRSPHLCMRHITASPTKIDRRDPTASLQHYCQATPPSPVVSSPDLDFPIIITAHPRNQVHSGLSPHTTTHMSEVQPARAPRGRSTARGGRGGYGPRGPRKTNGDGASPPTDTSAEQGELAALKKRYQPQLSTLKELFPDWTDAELVLAMEDSDGDLQTAIEKISEGELLPGPV